MTKTKIQKIIIPYPKPVLDGTSRIGGKGVFLQHLETYAIDKGISVEWTELKNAKEGDVILLSSGTKHIFRLMALRKKCKIVQRLDRWHSGKDFGPNISRRIKNFVSTCLINFIRKHIAHVVIYQSESVKNKWHQSWGGKGRGKEIVIYNGTNTEVFFPKKEKSFIEPVRILFVEGDYYDNHETNLILSTLQDHLPNAIFTLVGNIPNTLKDKFHATCFNHIGLLPHDKMPEIYRQHDIYISLEKDAPCPNSVIEAMSSGLPVAGFEWGAMPEIVGTGSGILIQTAHPESINQNEVLKLIHAINMIKIRYENFSQNARSQAQDQFSLQKICSEYLHVIIR